MREIAFVGASNAGKSSAINAISNQKNLPRLVKHQAKQNYSIFFKTKLGYIVDFPGYGYSKVSKSQKKDWARELPKYFFKRKSYRGAVLFTDIRNPMRELDLTMFEMLASYDLPILIVLTKTDKVSKDEAETVYKKINNSFSDSLSFSIKDNVSIEKLVKGLMCFSPVSSKAIFYF